jgi:hypothetical protein
MDSEGFNTISSALADAQLEAIVTPEPAEGENLRYVTVETSADIPASLVLNALAKARLTFYDGPSEGMSTKPELQPLGVNPGTITFDDVNAGRGRYQ